MANVNRPNGFRPAKSLLGTPWNGLVRYYKAANRSADATGNHGDIYVGDPVKISGGLVLPANSGDTVIGVAVAIGKGGATFDERQTGYFDPENLMKRYLAYSEDGVVAVCPAEGVLFEVQTASDLDLVPGSQADITVTAATAHGSRVTGVSTAQLTTDSNHDVEVVENVTTPGNDVTAAYARHLVKFI